MIGFLINLAVVVYLLLRKRLFGLRGGAAADEAERARDMRLGGDRAGHAADPRSSARRGDRRERGSRRLGVG